MNSVISNEDQMKEYFLLQLRMTTRRIKDAGIEPWVGYTVLLLGFAGFSIYLFQRTPFAAYILVLLGLSLTARLSETNRNEFLHVTFGDKKARVVRLLENLATISPFLLFLLIRQAFVPGLTLLLGSGLIALVNININLSFTLPTPFSAKPFEFSSGFRKSLHVITAAYILSAIAVSAGNFNLGIFSMLILFAVAMGYHTKPEDGFFIWIHNKTARQFLFSKLKTAVIFSSLLALPVALLLGISFPSEILLILLFGLIGIAFLVCTIVSKYSIYPAELNIPQIISLTICVWLPPALLLLIPYLFLKSEKRLSRLLK